MAQAVAALPSAMLSSASASPALPDLALPDLALPDLGIQAAAQLAQAQNPPAQNPAAQNPAAQNLAHSGPATAPVAASSASAPAAQLAPALVQLSHAPHGAAITLRLDPAELGHVQIRVERTADGAASVQVTAERPDTLRLLMADQPQLHRALDSAGVQQDGRSLTLSLGTPDGGQTAGGNGQPASGGGQPGGERQQRQSYAGTAASSLDALASPSAWLRAGVDITA